MSDFFREWSYAVRKLRSTPTSTLVAILVLAIAIGANSAIFTLTDNLSVTTPAGTEADKVYLIGTGPRDPQFQNFYEFDGAFGETIEQSFDAFESLSRVTQYWLTISQIEKPLRIQGLRVSEGFLRDIGVSAFSGRAFETQDFQPGAIPGAMLTRQTWQDGWGSSPDALDSIIHVSGKPHRIVGILPDSFTFERREFGIVTASNFKEDEMDGIYFWYYNMAGKLKPGVTEEQARAALKAIEPQLKGLETYPGYWDRRTLDIKKLNQNENSFVEDQIQILLSVGLVILFIAAFNVTNLTLVRLNQRGGEYATRAALGASRWDLLRISIYENGTLVALGFLLGIGVGYGLIQIVVTRFSGAEWGFLAMLNGDLGLNIRVLAWTGLACIIALLIISLTTLFFSNRNLINVFIKQDTRSATGSKTFHFITNSLLFLKIAFTCGLLIIGTFFYVSLEKVKDYQYGYEIDNILHGNINLPFYRFDNGEGSPELLPMLHSVLEEVRKVPGVEDVSYSKLQFPHWGWRQWIRLADTPKDIADSDLPESWKGIVYPGFFDLIGMQISQGETFTPIHNTIDAEKVTIVNQAFVEAYFGEEKNPLGQHVETSLMGTVSHFRIIGVVNNTHRWWRDNEAEPTMYFANSADAAARHWSWVYIKSPNWDRSVEQAVLDAVKRIDKENVITSFEPLGRLLDQSQGSFRFIVFIQTLVSSIGFILSCVGIYSAVSYSVIQKRRDTGIRLALGASPASVRNRILVRTLALLTPAIVIGYITVYVALVPMNKLEDQLYLVQPGDWRIYLFACLTLLAVGIAAALQPALRSARIDPNQALYEH
ncbi:ABC transporter permease [Pelagicoccus mobilis]|uniref:ABC transporter permease n=1 Tax=Pelagicoccus mobilis TaxID=415221 RepID=A0A934S342_9BACT|nr:ABC transporter permease [Pelagicoccus mobilis]MBK1880214.1 ABC transporter permease [Pelagicoccus mobilis]